MCLPKDAKSLVLAIMRGVKQLETLQKHVSVLHLANMAKHWTAHPLQLVWLQAPASLSCEDGAFLVLWHLSVVCCRPTGELVAPEEDEDGDVFYDAL